MTTQVTITSIMKTGYAVLVGRSNVGKSTLLNSLVGSKVAITTPKPQTTRRPVQGVLSQGDSQAVFVDTPGILQKSRDELTEKLTSYVKNSLDGIDMILYVVDPTREIGNEERSTLRLIEDIDKPKLLVINKIDDKKSNKYIDFYRDLGEKDIFDGCVEVSATRRSNLDILQRWIFDHLPEGQWMYPEGQMSNMRPEEQVAEIIREKLFLRLRQEVPYSTHVEVDEIEQRKSGAMYISARILTTTDRYKSMIIGAGGQGIKEIGQSSRKELTAVSNQKVFLDLKVETDPHWITRF